MGGGGDGIISPTARSEGTCTVPHPSPVHTHAGYLSEVWRGGGGRVPGACPLLQFEVEDKIHIHYYII